MMNAVNSRVSGAVLMAALSFFAVALGQTAWAQDLDPTLQKIKDSNTLVIGYRPASPPFSFIVTEEDGREYGEPGEILGYSIDLCRAVADGLRESLELPNLAIEYREISPSDRLEALEAGEIDIVCGSTTHTLKRREQVAFSLLTFATGIGLLVQESLDITSAENFIGKSVGVVTDTTAHEALVKGMRRRDLLGKVDIVFFEDHDEGLKALEEKTIAAYAGDQILLARLADKAKEPEKLYLMNRLYSYEPYALAVRRDSPDFLIEVDRSLTALYRSRDVLDIFYKWFDELGVLANEPLMRALYNLQAIPEGR